MFERVFLAPNNGAIGGGEVMLLRIAQTLRVLGVDVTVVAPQPSTVLEEADRLRLDTVGLDAADRVSWIRELRRWDRRRPEGLLWCNGLVPAFATSGRANRLVHLHQHPAGAARRTMAKAALWRAEIGVVPSMDMLRISDRVRVLPNWTDELRAVEPRAASDAPFRVGFLGRLGVDKGVHVLADAMRMLDTRQPGGYRLVLGGESRFVSQHGVDQMETALAPVTALTERMGWVEADDFFSKIDLLVVPSIVNESFGLVAAEAMSARLPLIVSDAGALPEVVGGLAATVPAGDAVRLADRIAAAASGLAQDSTEALYARWLAEYSPAAGLAHTRELVDSLGILRAA